jgi:signal transduction histidine kinase
MNIRRARIRLTAIFIATFAVVLGVFSVVFYVAFSFVLQPDFDITPELTNAQVADAAYAAAIGRIGASLIIANAVAVLVVGIVSWVLAKRALEPIREAHLRQQRFVADASHETRNPLAAIKTTASAALDGERSAADLREALVAVDEAVDRLIRLTGDLLTLARSNDPLAPTSRERADLSVIVNEALEVAGPSRPGQRVDVSLEPDLPVTVDAAEIERVVRNLYENAVRYSGEDGAISLRTWADDDSACLDVVDDGPGIAAADLSRIFEPFYRSEGQARDRSGTGLGLAIARDLADRNGGALSVSSRPGSGATFRLTLPRLR